jgi:dihydroorotate dehydrogenase electron transfer subunit
MASEAPLLETATLISREQVAPGFWCLGLRGPRIARSARSAGYVAIDVPGAFSVRLPLGIWTARNDEFSVLFREWGERTIRLSRLSVGTPLSCIGPLGNEFSIPAKGSNALIVAGGIGIAPFWLLARDLRNAGVSVRAIVGARTKAHLCGVAQLREAGADVTLCTDDGSEGERATVVELAKRMQPADIMYGCGPPAMLRALCDVANAARVPCEISMEETFGCSMGTCWGCVVPVRRGSRQGTGYPPAPRDSRGFDLARVCIDGTVFSASDVLWLEAYA